MPNPVPRHVWDERSGRYRDVATGRYISPTQIRGALDAAIESSSERMRGLSQQLREGKLDVPTWQAQMRAEVKATHLASTALAKGGWNEMTQADFGRAGRTIRTQYDYLDKMAAQIASGQQRLDGTLLRRTEMYIEAGRGTYHEVERAEMVKRGNDEERSVRSARDSCGGCIREEGRGWVPVGSLVPIGRRDCLSHCQCRIEYRIAALAEAA